MTLITHPPLPVDRLREIAQQHKGNELLLREVERLRRLELAVRWSLELPPGDPRRSRVRRTLQNILDGQLEPPYRYGIETAPTRGSQRAARQAFTAQQPPQNYRRRGELVDTQKAPGDEG